MSPNKFNTTNKLVLSGMLWIFFCMYFFPIENINQVCPNDQGLTREFGLKDNLVLVKKNQSDIFVNLLFPLCTTQ